MEKRCRNINGSCKWLHRLQLNRVVTTDDINNVLYTILSAPP